MKTFGKFFGIDHLKQPGVARVFSNTGSHLIRQCLKSKLIIRFGQCGRYSTVWSFFMVLQKDVNGPGKISIQEAFVSFVRNRPRRWQIHQMKAVYRVEKEECSNPLIEIFGVSHKSIDRPSFLQQSVDRNILAPIGERDMSNEIVFGQDYIYQAHLSQRLFKLCGQVIAFLPFEFGRGMWRHAVRLFTCGN